MPLPKEKFYTLADALTWDEQDRIELIQGSPVMMAPPSRMHQKISGELFGQLREYLKGKKCEVYSAPFAVRLFEEKDDRPENVEGARKVGMEGILFENYEQAWAELNKRGNINI